MHVFACKAAIKGIFTSTPPEPSIDPARLLIEEPTFDSANKPEKADVLSALKSDHLLTTNNSSSRASLKCVWQRRRERKQA
jgi:hypothetical protein